ncbi:hypothetical protein [uncultured Cytophaga sp.]|uniref:hypothetical protein n=1 Tax=uncultured Cytophaga sp. TaxID=160238 RepID=UPI00262F748D|nr:hypothetical protein [uncultured Cytophaga sp.]
MRALLDYLNVGNSLTTSFVAFCGFLDGVIPNGFGSVNSFTPLDTENYHLFSPDSLYDKSTGDTSYYHMRGGSMLWDPK